MGKKENSNDTEEVKQQDIKETPDNETAENTETVVEENQEAEDLEEHTAFQGEEIAEAGTNADIKEKETRSSTYGQKDSLKNEDAEKMATDLKDLKDKHLRLYAEFDNYRKRTSKEKIELIKTASQNVLVSILPVVDDFQRAIKMAQDDSTTETMPAGVLLIYEKLMNALEKKGLKMMETEGRDFDAELHEAITKVPAGEELSGKIVETVEAGYYLNDKIIRYAKVVVGQ